MKAENIFEGIPVSLREERFEDIVCSKAVRIERILSKGQVSPEAGWYDQEENEWVIVLKGKGILEFEDGSTCTLGTGDYLNIPARCRHRVHWTDPDNITIWLAVFYH